MIQFITSCITGDRDFAYGRFDQYMLGRYIDGLKSGSLTRDHARAIIAHLFVKTKEITGTATDNYSTKPIPCFASNEYIVIGGRSPNGKCDVNELSYLVLEAATLAEVPQPGINIRIDPDYPASFKTAVAQAIETCGPQINLWNDRLILDTLEKYYPQIDRADAYDYAWTACNRINFPGKENITHGERWYCMPGWLNAAMNEGREWHSRHKLTSEIPHVSKIRTFDELMGHIATYARAELNKWSGGAAFMAGSGEIPTEFRFDSVLLQDCIARCKEARGGGVKYRTQFHIFTGVATLADSLMALKRLVFEDQRYTLAEFNDILLKGFEGHEQLRQEIINTIPKYGNNDEEVDAIARRVTEIGYDAMESIDNPSGLIMFPGLYSLYVEYLWMSEVPTTPDGRRKGEPISENQSAVHGADSNGLAAMLQSAARLPHERSGRGGLNVRFAGKMTPETLVNTIDTYFRLGGQHLSIMQIDKATLREAQAHPDQYRTLCVRIGGFSDYFVSLSPTAQEEIIARTEY